MQSTAATLPGKSLQHEGGPCEASPRSRTKGGYENFGYREGKKKPYLRSVQEGAARIPLQKDRPCCNADKRSPVSKEKILSGPQTRKKNHNPSSTEGGQVLQGTLLGSSALGKRQLRLPRENKDQSRLSQGGGGCMERQKNLSTGEKKRTVLTKKENRPLNRDRILGEGLTARPAGKREKKRKALHGDRGNPSSSNAEGKTHQGTSRQIRKGGGPEQA